MLKPRIVCAFSIYALVAMSFPTGASAQVSEQPIPLNDVPIWVLSAANQAAQQFFGPAAVLITAHADPEGEFLTYEFKGAARGSLGFEIDILPDGKLDEVEEIIEASAVPADVMAQLSTFFPNFQPTVVEKSTRAQDNGLTSVWYEFEGRLRGSDVDIEINARTKSILLEAD